MIYETKEVALSDIPAHVKESFSLENVAGRDALAEQIEKDLDEYCAKAFTDGPRSHLGASVVGHECARYIWFHFRWMFFETIKGQKARLFNRGHLEEDRIVSWLRGIGFDVKQVDEASGKQIRIADASGHFGGSCDGNAILPTRYGNLPAKLLLEFKTANDKQFQGMKNTGVVKAKPRYWSQMCAYGAKLNIRYALFIAINKNDDELDVEVLELNHDTGKAEIDKALYIIESTMPPHRISDDASFWQCKWCPAQGICHLNAPIEQNCRSCQFATPVADAQWYCAQWKQNIPPEHIAKGCDAWRALPSC